MLLEFGKASYLNKVRQQLEKAAQVINKMKTDGVAATLEAVEGSCYTTASGYCNVGRVIAIGDEVSNFQLGDRVISNGNHAEVVAVPQNLVAKVLTGSAMTTRFLLCFQPLRFKVSALSVRQLERMWLSLALDWSDC